MIDPIAIADLGIAAFPGSSLVEDNEEEGPRAIGARSGVPPRP